MKTPLLILVVVCAMGVMVVGCFKGGEGEAIEERSPKNPPEATVEQMTDRLHEIADSYHSLVHSQLDFRVTIVYCAPSPKGSLKGLTPEMPSENLKSDTPTAMSVSSSSDSTTHGKKLFRLYFKASLSWDEALQRGCSPVGQVVVKEAWVPEEVKDDGKPLAWVRDGNPIPEESRWMLPYARRNGKLYHAKEKAGLFIMHKMDPKTPGTDDGWIYGTVTPDGKTVTAAGRIESCMACHQNAPNDRLFGIRKE